MRATTLRLVGFGIFALAGAMAMVLGVENQSLRQRLAACEAAIEKVEQDGASQMAPPPTEPSTQRALSP